MAFPTARGSACSSPNWLGGNCPGTGDRLEEYYTAFFGLSVGLERLAKLVLLIDHALSERSQMHQNVVSRYGHKLLDLTNAADEVVSKRNLRFTFQRPTNAISAKNTYHSICAAQDADFPSSLTDLR